LFMALLFLITGLGVGVYYFWQATHPAKNNKPLNQQASNCSISLVQGSAVLPAPEIFKPDGAVSQLSTTDLEAGSGAEAKAGSCITVKYYGTLAASGQSFDEDFTKPSALKLQLGVGQVIPGWDQGVVGMKAGGLRRLVIPFNLAYGPRGACKSYKADQKTCDVYAIPPNSDLIFVVKLLSIQ